MKKIFLFIIIFCNLIFAQDIFADPIPLNGEWNERDLRSAMPIPFSVEKEGDVLYLYSSKKIEDVSVRIVSATTGDVFYEEVHMFIPSDCIELPLREIPDGACIVEFTHEYGVLSGYFNCF